MSDIGKETTNNDKTSIQTISIFLIYSLIIFGSIGLLLSGPYREIELPYSQFISELNAGAINDLVIDEKRISGKFVSGQNNGKNFTTTKVES